MQEFFRCEEGKEAECRKILIKMGVKKVTDMIYEARIAAVVRIEAAKGLTCTRDKAIYKYPKAHEYNSVSEAYLANTSCYSLHTCMANT